MKDILVAYEESPVSGRVLERAAELAQAFGAAVTVTSVAPVAVGVRTGTQYNPADPPIRHEEELHDARARLTELGVPGVETVTGIGDPPETIVELAAQKGSDLIVIGAHEGGLLSRIFPGSTTDDVVHKATVDVLIVH